MTKDPGTPPKGADGDGAAAEIDPALVAGDGPGDSAGEPDPLALLEAEKLDLREKLLRTLADMENLRRRTEREVADARAYAVTSFARDMLTVADNMRRALESAPPYPDPGQKTFLDGVELTERDLLKILERHGVKRLDPKGARFDPNMHQAMFEVPDESVASGTVMQVVQTGYAIGERVLRPALVGVSKGGPKATSPGPEPLAGAGSADA